MRQAKKKQKQNECIIGSSGTTLPFVFSFFFLHTHTNKKNKKIQEGVKSLPLTTHTKKKIPPKNI